MPTFRFQLTNPRIHLEAKEDSDKWSLSFDATIERPERDHHGYRDSFEVICGGKKYDGFKLTFAITSAGSCPSLRSNRGATRDPIPWTLTTDGWCKKERAPRGIS